MHEYLFRDTAPTFSVVIPLFNKEKSVKRAIQSVLSQAYTDFQLIVVDDGSTDNSLALVEQVRDPRLIIVRQENGGVSKARNAGWRAADSEYVCFLDADDEWLPNHLQQLADQIRENPGAVMFSNRYSVVTPDGKKSQGRAGLMDGYRGVVSNFYDAYRKSRSLVNSSNVCLTTGVLEAIGGFPDGENVGEDVYVWLSAASLGNVCHDTRNAVIIHQDAENRTNTRIAPQIPFFLRWFLVESPKSPSGSLLRLLGHFSIIYAAVAAMERQRALAQTYATMIYPHSKFYAVCCLIAASLPPRWIEVTKRARSETRRK